MVYYAGDVAPTFLSQKDASVVCPVKVFAYYTKQMAQLRQRIVDEEDRIKQIERDMHNERCIKQELHDKNVRLEAAICATKGMR